MLYVMYCLHEYWCTERVTGNDSCDGSSVVIQPVYEPPLITSKTINKVVL